jgi:transposase InsO family protein
MPQIGKGLGENYPLGRKLVTHRPHQAGIIDKFPFRIKEIRTDNGHEFQAKFHWHVEDLGIRHAYIKRGTPQLNGKFERSHRSVQQEFYQLMSYKDDVDLEAKLDEWERFYNFHRPHGAFNGKTPYEALREKL